VRSDEETAVEKQIHVSSSTLDVTPPINYEAYLLFYERKKGLSRWAVLETRIIQHIQHGYHCAPNEQVDGDSQFLSAVVKLKTSNRDRNHNHIVIYQSLVNARGHFSVGEIRPL